MALRALGRSQKRPPAFGRTEGISSEQFRVADNRKKFKGKVAIVIPAYNEADNIDTCSIRSRPRSADLRPPRWSSTTVLTAPEEVAEAHGAVVIRHVVNRGGGAALRTGYRLMVDSEAAIVVTLDADGQHPGRDAEPGSSWSRRQGRRRPWQPGAWSRRGQSLRREMGIVFFQPAGLLHHPDPRHRLFERLPGSANFGPPHPGCSAGAVPHFRVHDRGDQAGVPAVEVPVTVEQRLHGHSKKPAVFRYGNGPPTPYGPEPGFAGQSCKSNGSPTPACRPGRAPKVPQVSDRIGPKPAAPQSSTRVQPGQRTAIPFLRHIPAQSGHSMIQPHANAVAVGRAFTGRHSGFFWWWQVEVVAAAGQTGRRA